MEGGVPHGKGRSPAALGRLLLLRRVGQGRLQHLRQAFRQGDGHFVADTFRQLDEVGLVVLGQGDVVQARAVAALQLTERLAGR